MRLGNRFHRKNLDDLVFCSESTLALTYLHGGQAKISIKNSKFRKDIDYGINFDIAIHSKYTISLWFAH